MNQELLRIVDGLARDKNIDPETVFEDLEELIEDSSVGLLDLIEQYHGERLLLHGFR